MKKPTVILKQMETTKFTDTMKSWVSRFLVVTWAKTSGFIKHEVTKSDVDDYKVGDRIIKFNLTKSLNFAMGNKVIGFYYSYPNPNLPGSYRRPPVASSSSGKIAGSEPVYGGSIPSEATNLPKGDTFA